MASRLPVTPGLGVSDQAVPFHVSTTVTEPVESAAEPTAVHAEAEVHETPVRLFGKAALVSGVATIAQVEPFHRSASVWR